MFIDYENKIGLGRHLYYAINMPQSLAKLWGIFHFWKFLLSVYDIIANVLVSLLFWECLAAFKYVNGFEHCAVAEVNVLDVFAHAKQVVCDV